MENDNFKNLYKHYKELRRKTSVVANSVNFGEPIHWQSLNPKDMDALNEIKIELTKLAEKNWSLVSLDDWSDILGQEEFLKKSQNIQEL